MDSKKKINKNKVLAVDIDATLFEALQDPEVAAAYVNDCLTETGRNGGKLLLAALMNVAQAQGISKLAKGSETKRRMIYKALSEDANPTILTLEGILENMGLVLDVRPLHSSGARHAAMAT